MGDITEWTFSTIPKSKRLADLPEAARFNVVVVGSGYGGSIAASRLAAAFKREGNGKTVCLLERGRDIRPGEYPRDLAGARKELQVVTARHKRLDRDANGMMEVRVGDDVHVITGNGLGGGSLVNAGVSIRPDMRVFESGWPKLYAPEKSAAGLTNILSNRFDRVIEKLGATRLPDDIGLAKLDALEQSAKAMKQPFERAEINVTFQRGRNYFGIAQEACNLCGDCCSGCNYGAKNTLLMNYIPDAMQNGAMVVTEAEVDTVVPKGEGWTVTVRDRAGTGPETVEITADMVILAAGALGSTELLGRSRRASKELARIKAVGTKFSANGDVLGFGFGANLPGSRGELGDPTPLYSIGAGVNAPDAPEYRPGPCITGVIRVDMDAGAPLASGLVIEDGTAPGPFAAIYPPAMFMQDLLTAEYTEFPDAVTRMRALAQLGAALQSGDDPAALSYQGVMTQMQSYLTMSHDSASGVLDFDEQQGRVWVEWQGAGDTPGYVRDNEKLNAAADAIWADYIPNPIWQENFGRNVVSVHPLGGCPMSDSDADGVTDPYCRVYKGDGKNSVFENFMICDGSIIPTSLGVNPLLTISAITEMAMDKLIGVEVGIGARPGAAPLPPLPGPPVSAAGGGIDWPGIALGIDAAREVADKIVDLSKEDPGFLNFSEIIGAIGLFLAGMIRNATVGDLAEFTTTFMGKATHDDSSAAYKDIGSAFALISGHLRKLHEVASGIPDESSMQDFLKAFFRIVGDVSPSFGFDETMHGHVSNRRASQDAITGDPYEIAEAFGRNAKTRLEAAFSIDAKSTLDHFAPGVAAQVARAALGGTVTLTANGEEVKYDVKNGLFDLLEPDRDRVEAWKMRYECLLQHPEKPYFSWRLIGEKHLRKREGSDWWTDLTTLFVDLEPMGPEPGTAQQGIIRLDLQDLAMQMTTLRTGFDCDATVSDLKDEVLAAGQDHTLTTGVANGSLIHKAFKLLLKVNSRSGADIWPVSLADGLTTFFGAGIAQLFGLSVLRSYGGFAAYMNDFSSKTDATLRALPRSGRDSIHGSICDEVSLPDDKAPLIRLYHFAPPDPDKPALGPIVLAPGMSTTSLGFALRVSNPSLVSRLLEENYDVWLFDCRFSPLVKPIHTNYTLDDVAREDWKMAIDHVLAHTVVPGAAGRTVQILGHCVGALTAQMALLGGYVETEKVRQMVLLQFTVHPAANWFNVVKSECGLAQDFVNGFPGPLIDLVHAELGDGKEWDELAPLLKKGMATINPVSPPAGSDGKRAFVDEVLNAVSWNAPFGIDHVCLSPTCHRIYGLYGPVIAHDNLDEATHNAMRQVFGEVATKPFEHLGLIMQRGRAVSSKGEDIYLPHVDRLNLPIHIISGADNQIILPESGYYTQQWLKESLPDSAAFFTRTQIEGYAHNDCFMGRNADRDVFGGIMDVLRRCGRSADCTKMS